MQQGWQLWQSDKMDEAIAKFQQAVKLAPDLENAWNGLGWASFNSGKVPEAKEAFERVVALNPNHPAALNGLGQLYLSQKKYAQAETYLLKAAPQAPAAWFGLARLYLLQGKFEEAEKFAQRIEDSGQSDDFARRMLKAAKEKSLPEGLRVMIEPQPTQSVSTTASQDTAAPTTVPQIVETSPRVGSDDVDPTISEITVTFDRDMSKGMSWTGGGPDFPPIAEGKKPAWRDNRTCVFPCKLEAAHYYRVGINSTSFQNFQSADGVPTRPSAIYFATKGASDEVKNRLKKPEIVAINPPNGAKDVDPATTELRVTFNVPMIQGFSWTGGGPNYPEITGRPHWTEDQKTCVLPVKLKPNWDYRLGLNSPSHKNFQSASGIPLEPVRYRFSTRGNASEAAAGQAVDKAVAAAEAWLLLIDKAQYAESWNDTAAAFKEKVPKADWEKAITTVRSPLGAAKSRTIKSATFTRHLPDAPPGEYVVIQFDAQFEKEQGIETITPMREKDGSWKISGYYYKSAENGKTATGPANEAVGKAQDAAKDWLKLIDDGKYGEGWDDTAAAFKSAVSKTEWEYAIKIARDPFGNAKSRTVKSATYTRSLPGAPVGEYVVIQFDAQFEKQQGVETITPMREKDGSWKVSGYYIKPAETGKATNKTLTDPAEQEPAKSENILANPGAETGDQSPDTWKQGVAIDGVTYSWDKNVASEGKASLCIEKTAQRYFPIAEWSQTVDRKGDKSALLVSAKVKAEKMHKAILDVLFLDKNGKWVSHQWAAYIGVKKNGDSPADHDWKTYSGKVKIPDNATQICVSLQVYGPGKVWFDDVRASYGTAAPKTVATKTVKEESSNDKLLDDSQRVYRDWTEKTFSSLLHASDEQPKTDAEEENKREEQSVTQLTTLQGRNTIPAINHLASIRSNKAVPRLLKIAADRREKDNRDRWMAIRALGLIGDPAAVPELIDLVYHPNQNTRFWAQISLVRLTGKNFGRDAAAWKKWWREQNGTPPVSDETVVWTSNPEWANPEKFVEIDRAFIRREGLRLTIEQQGADAVKAGATIPKIVSMTPANSVKDVDPSITELRVTFDVPMAGGFSWTGSGPNYPELAGHPHWSDDHKTCILPVKLKPGWDYALGLNSRSFKNFRSQSGVPLTPVRYRFTTRDIAETEEEPPTTP